MFSHGLFNFCDNCRGMENRFLFQESMKSTHRGVISHAIAGEYSFFLRSRYTLPACFTKTGIAPETIKILGDLGIKFAPSSEHEALENRITRAQLAISGLRVNVDNLDRVEAFLLSLRGA